MINIKCAKINLNVIFKSTEKLFYATNTCDMWQKLQMQQVIIKIIKTCKIFTILQKHKNYYINNT